MTTDKSRCDSPTIAATHQQIACSALVVSEYATHFHSGSTAIHSPWVRDPPRTQHGCAMDSGMPQACDPLACQPGMPAAANARSSGSSSGRCRTPSLPGRRLHVETDLTALGPAPRRPVSAASSPSCLCCLCRIARTDSRSPRAGGRSQPRARFRFRPGS